MEDENHLVITRNKTGIHWKICILIAIAIPTVLLVCAIASIIGLVLAGNLTCNSGATANGTANTTDSSLCTTPSCVELAATVLRSMNASIDPCEDFYNYSCGGWEARNTIPSGYGSWGVFNELANQNTIYLKKLLSGSFGNSIAAIERVRKLYSSCMDLDELDKLGSSSLLDTVNYTGGWDLINVHNG